MKDRAFLDSNILVYFIDEGNSYKQNIARGIIDKLIESKGGQISTQSLQEFYNVATKKLKCPKEIAKKAVDYYIHAFPVHCNTPKDILAAIGISIKSQLSFYDSLIIAAACAENCSVVYSEDLNNGQTVNGVQIINPFK